MNFLAAALLAGEWNQKYLVWSPDPRLWGQSTHSRTSRGEEGEKETEGALSFSQWREKLTQLSYKRRQGDWCNGCVIIFERQHPVGWGQGSQLNTRAHRFMYHQFIRLIAVAIKVITAFSKRKGREFRQQNPGETLEREKYKEEGSNIWSSGGYKTLLKDQTMINERTEFGRSIKQEDKNHNMTWNRIRYKSCAQRDCVLLVSMTQCFSTK